ncbi:hypothetical protein PV327_009865 [Microctonus hyperodae]|uniref:SH3 domain-containing protein n=1 Tax=Microctonus hyperodae TaxID=165561 RepID=A0AA39F1V3_MICHY|nr:hypothetical protein PV327_009865 [Microctonus hyperodae]
MNKKKMDAIVEYNYVAQESDELTIRKGDVIKDIKVMSGGWWEGTLRDKRGMFPDNFVKMLEGCSIGPNVIAELKNEAEGSNHAMKKEGNTLKNGTTGRKWCKVLYSYDACNEDELSLVPDDLVEFISEVEEGWWSGRLHGRAGVFPSNFVSPPVPEEIERQQINKDRNVAEEYCRVLFSYAAANEDELSIVEGDLVKILSRDAPDKGWWKGSLRGKVGLFPDNFVKIIDFKDPFQHEQEMWQETNQAVAKISGAKPSSSLHTGKRGEKAHARKSLELNATSFLSSEKKNVNHSVGSTSLERMMGKNEVKIMSNAEAFAKADEELDGVEREEDTPLLHLTASRAKAPRRRLPSSHHVRNHGGNMTTVDTIETQSPILLEETVTNGTIDTVDQSRDEEVERLTCKTRRKVPWIEELKLNQMEKKKIQPDDKYDRPEIHKKERNYSRISGGSESAIELRQDNGNIKSKDKESDTNRTDLSHISTTPISPSATNSTTPAYVPYRLYCQLLERVSDLEAKQTQLEEFVVQLSERLNSSAISNKL